MTTVSISVTVATALAVFAIYFSIRQILSRRWLLRSDAPPAPQTRNVTWTLAILALPFTWFLGFVIGGNFGGALAGSFAESSRLDPGLLIPFGIGVGIFLVTSVGAIGIGLLGFVLGRLIERARGLSAKRE